MCAVLWLLHLLSAPLKYSNYEQREQNEIVNVADAGLKPNRQKQKNAFTLRRKGRKECTFPAFLLPW